MLESQTHLKNISKRIFVGSSLEISIWPWRSVNKEISTLTSTQFCGTLTAQLAYPSWTPC